MIKEKIPTIFAYSGCRIYQDCIKRHFSDILPLELPSGNKIMKFDKTIAFFEYVGNNIEMLKTMEDIIKNITVNDIFLVIDDSYEGLADTDFLEKLSKMLEKHKVITNWRMYSSNYNLGQDIKKIFGTSNNFVYFNIHLHMPEFDFVVPAIHKFEVNTDLRKKKFLCVNRQERLHRLRVVDFLIKENMLEDSYISCMLGDYKAALTGTDFQASNPELEKYQDADLLTALFTEDQKKRLLSTLPIEIDVRQEQYKSFSTNMPLLDNFFKESYFSIVTEGDFSSKDNKKQFTEKVVKCFLYYHPFVVIGLPGTLDLIRDHGFLTFSGFIDESYDSEINDDKRLNMALKEIKKLHDLNIHELKNMYEQMLPILQHNFNLAKHINSTPVPTKLINELLQWYRHSEDDL